MYLFDTNVIVEFLRGRLPDGLKLLKETDSRLIKIPAIVEAELYLGALKSANCEKNMRAIEELLCNFEVLPFDSRCARAYAQIRSQLESAGTPIGPNDLVIAATAIVHDAILVTNNAREFKRVPNLRLMSMGHIELK